MTPSAIFSPHALDGHVALITGGGTGLGKAAARELLACGARVLIAAGAPRCSRRPARSSATGARRSPATSASPTGCAAIVDVCLERFGRLDTLVNNAGGQYFVPAESIALKGWQAVSRLNVGGTLAMARVALRARAEPGGGGMVVNVTLSPHHGLPGMTHSSAARAAVEGATRELAAEWADDGVAVCAVAAGHFETEAIQKYPERRARRRRPQRAARPPRPPRGARLARSPCSPRRWAAASAARSSRSTARATTGTAPGRRGALVDESGGVPTEARRPSG